MSESVEIYRKNCTFSVQGWVLFLRVKRILGLVSLSILRFSFCARSHNFFSNIDVFVNSVWKEREICLPQELGEVASIRALACKRSSFFKDYSYSFSQSENLYSHSTFVTVFVFWLFEWFQFFDWYCVFAHVCHAFCTFLSKTFSWSFSRKLQVFITKRVFLRYGMYCNYSTLCYVSEKRSSVKIVRCCLFANSCFFLMYCYWTLPQIGKYVEFFKIFCANEVELKVRKHVQ